MTMVYRDMNAQRSFVNLSDSDLLLTLKRLVDSECLATAAVVAAVAEVEARRLFLGEGCPSLFAYCTRVLHLSEPAAYARIAAARAGLRFPIVLELLNRGELSLTTTCLLAPHLTEDNHQTVLKTARHKGKRDVERMIAELHPRPDVPSTIRKLPAPATPAVPLTLVESATVSVESAPTCVQAAPQGAPHVSPPRMQPPARVVPAMTRPPVVAPLAPERFKVQFTVGRETHDKLRRAQDLMRHAVPNGDPAAIFDRALTLLVEHLERTKLASVRQPRLPRAATAHSRHIPSAVKRAVWTRDRGRCTFVGTQGRCAEPGFVEFHHVVPYASGGAATVDNIQLRCRAHNQYEAQEDFGPPGLFVRERTPPRTLHP
jgi:5-methylcytosine-specific restriction endonuclease McrA